MEKVILDTEALLRNRKNINALLAESDMSYYLFDFQVMVIQHWQFALNIGKLKRQLNRMHQNGEEGLALLELELMKSKRLLELMKLELEMKDHETILEGIIGKDLLKRLTIPEDIRNAMVKFEIDNLKVIGIKKLIPNETNLAMAKEALSSYEKVYNTKLTSAELLNLFTYLTCGFSGHKCFLESNKKRSDKYEIPNTWSKFNLQLIRL
jgi:hypothetical protein